MYYARRAYSVSNIWTLSDTIQGFTKHFSRGDNIVITNKNPNNDVIAKHYKVKETKVVRNKEIKVKDKSTYLRMKKDLDGVKRQYKLAMKKIEYFQSWCSSMWTDGVGSEITKEIESFVDNWRMPELAEIESQKIETMIGNMLKNDEDDENDLSIVESTRNNYPFRMGCELVAVSTVNKNDGSLVTTINNLTEASKF